MGQDSSEPNYVAALAQAKHISHVPCPGSYALYGYIYALYHHPKCVFFQKEMKCYYLKKRIVRTYQSTCSVPRLQTWNPWRQRRLSPGCTIAPDNEAERGRRKRMRFTRRGAHHSCPIRAVRHDSETRSFTSGMARGRARIRTVWPAGGRGGSATLSRASPHSAHRRSAGCLPVVHWHWCASEVEGSGSPRGLAL
jgi:hypothetical protein